MKAKIKSMRIKFVATCKNDSGEWSASEHVHEVDGYEGKVTRASAERELAKRHDGTENMFYNIISVAAITKTIEI